MLADALGNHPPTIDRPVSDLSIPADIEFEFNLRPSGTVVFGFDVGGTNLRATDNYFASNVRFFDSWDDVAFTDNTIVSRDTARAVTLDESPSVSSDGGNNDWDRNRYISNSSKPFLNAGQLQSWDDWRSVVGADAAGTLTDALPENLVAVRPNQYDLGRGHAIVYNWQRDDVVEIDLSSVVEVGASYQILNVLDLHGDPVVSGNYAGGSVPVPMTNVTSPVPLGHQPAAPLVVDKEFATFLIVSDAPPSATTGNEYFVATDGTPNGNGSRENPWDLATALAHPAAVLPGDTIWVFGGTYSGRVTSSLTGTVVSPIQVREYPGEVVKIDLFQGAEGQSKRFSIEGQHTVFQGMEIFSSDPSSRTTQLPGSFPDDLHRGDFNVLGDHIKLINLEIHDLNNGIGYWSRGEGGEVYGCLIYNNGWIGPDRNHGHAIYSQNEDTLRVFEDNITFSQFRNGIKVYGSDQSSLKNYSLHGNVSFNNGGGEGEGFTGTYQYLIGGGSPAENIDFRENYTYVGKHHFGDVDAGDSLTYTARQANGQPLPSWLTFFGDEGFFRGTPTSEDVGTMEIEVTATDESGDSVTDTFEITVRPPQSSDVKAPDVASLDVPDESTEVAVNADFSVTFDEAIQPGSGNILILRASDGMAEQTIDVQSTETSILGSELRFDPPQDLAADTEYFIQIYPESILDLAGNPFAGIQDAETWNFTTASPPRVSQIVVNGGDPQRSSITEVTATFTTQVEIDFVGGDPFQFVNTKTGKEAIDQPVVSVQDGVTVVEFSFAPGTSVGPSGSLLDGDYRLMIDASLISAHGLSLDGNGDGIDGDNYQFVENFYRRFGDHNGNGVVDLLDFATFRRTFGLSETETGYQPSFDSDGNRAINLLDFAAFRRNFGV